jgi:hypothetical protein
LTRPSTPRRLRDESWQRREWSQRPKEESFFDLAGRLLSFSAPKRVDGRDKPGQDASGPSPAATTCGNFCCQQLPPIRVVQFIDKCRISGYLFLQEQISGERSGREKEEACPQKGVVYNLKWQAQAAVDFLISFRCNSLKSLVSQK